jgi:hypothetical protein
MILEVSPKGLCVEGLVTSPRPLLGGGGTFRRWGNIISRKSNMGINILILMFTCKKNTVNITFKCFSLKFPEQDKDDHFSIEHFTKSSRQCNKERKKASLIGKQEENLSIMW